MTEINEESRYDAGESRQLGRNERDVLIASNKGEDYEQEMGGSTISYRKSKDNHNVSRSSELSEKYRTNNQTNCDTFNNFIFFFIKYFILNTFLIGK